MPKPFLLYVKYVDYVSEKVGRIAMLLVFVMIGVLLLDAVTRNVINIPQSWCVEMAQFTMAAYYILGGPYSMQLGDHVRMDLIYDRVSETMKAKLDVATSGCLLFYLSTLLFGSISSTIYAIETGSTESSPCGTPPWCRSSASWSSASFSCCCRRSPCCSRTSPRRAARRSPTKGETPTV